MRQIEGQLAGITVGDGVSVAIMGVINLDPSSFYLGFSHEKPKQALAAVEKMIEEGVDIIDVGGVSTAPGSPPVSIELESKRVSGLVKAIAERWDVPISIDTQRAQVAEQTLRLGARIVNDVSGLKADSDMAKTIQDAGASSILMSFNHQPGDSGTIRAVLSSLRVSLERAYSVGIPRNRIAIDPGIGFGKPAKCDLAILHNLNQLRSLHHPILVGPSRKSFIGNVLGYPSPAARLAGTLAVVTVASMLGAHIIRAHDVRPTRDCIKMVEAIQSTKEGE